MNHKGSVTVFLCLIMSSMILVGMTALEIVSVYNAKAKAAMNARTAVSSIKAEYNSYIFEHYHILLFDKNQSGAGEAYLEEKIKGLMEENLGGEFAVKEAVVTDFRLIAEDGCEALKEQIYDHMKYAAVGYGADRILGQTGGTDGTLSDEIKQDMEEAKHGEVAENVEAGDSVPEGGGEEKKDPEDPRNFAKKAGGSGMLALLMPEDMEISTVKIDQSNLPSKKNLQCFPEEEDINRNFDDYDRMREDMEKGGNWADFLTDAGCGVAYAGMVFNCAVDQEVNTDAVLSCEREYLICGESSDYENLDKVVRKITAIRLPVNFAYLVTDTKKMSEIKALSVPISAFSLVPEPVVRYLLAGSWAYVEALADVRLLLKGSRVPFIKNAENWITDLDNLEASMEQGEGGEEEGLSYEDYLTILLSVNTDKMYDRMLDLMQENAGLEQEGFEMSNAAVGLTANLKVLFRDREFYIRETGGY